MRLVVVMVALLVAGCPGFDANYPYANEPDPRSKEIMLGVGDVVLINVWGEGNAALNTEATIRPDGTITMPLVGDLKASGMSPSQLKASIRTRLADFIKLEGSEITVAVKAWRSYRFTVQGEVMKTGVYTSEEYVTVADALALAGGPTRFAKRSQIVLLRRTGATAKRIPLDYETLASGANPAMNIFVLPGDTIYVP